MGTWETDVTPPTLGVSNTPLGSGLAVPAGDVLCAYSQGTPAADVWAAGYSVPSPSVPAEPLRASLADRPQP